MKIVNDSNKQSVDLDQLIEDTFQKYTAVFFSEIDGQLYSYRPLGRKEYKDILNIYYDLKSDLLSKEIKTNIHYDYTNELLVKKATDLANKYKKKGKYSSLDGKRHFESNEYYLEIY